MLKRFAGILALVGVSALFMLGYRTNANQTAVTYQAPKDCDLSVMITAFDKQIPGSQYVPTDWQPADGTQLKLFLDNSGIACTYGIQTAEVGGTVLWMVDENGLFNKQEKTWKSEQYRAIDIPDLTETAAYLLPVTATGVDGAYIWEVNLLVDDLWISLGGSFIQDINEVTDIINAAIEVARK